MESEINEDELVAAIAKLRQEFELLRQGQPPPSPPPVWETWFQKALPGIAHAVLVDAIWPVKFVWMVLRFCVLEPFATQTVIHGLFNVYRNVEWTEDAARHYVDAFLVVTGYVGSHLLQKILHFMFLSCRYLLAFVWMYSMWACTVCGTLVGPIFLMRVQGITIANIGWRLINQALSLGHGMTIVHFKFLVVCRKLSASIKRSSGIRMCRSFLTYCILRILGRPTFDELEMFEYSPLSPGQRPIRVLRLAHQNPLFDIRADLVCCSLDYAPPYEAISYVWGKATQKEHRVILNGRKFFVSTNVYQILCRRGSMFSSRDIWIDSICINQRDNAEKNDQVRMMKDIYNRAFNVSVCLGEHQDAWLAWNMIKQLAYYRAFLTREGLISQVFYMMQIKDRDERVSAQLTAFIDLIDHLWFNRVWVIQEVVVARSVNILYGNEQLSWQQFIQAMEILFNPPIEGISPLLQHTGEGAVSRPLPFGPTHAAFMNEYREMFASKRLPPLYKTLRLFQAFESSEPMDKMLALLGLTESAAELVHIIDYNRPLHWVLVEVSDAILEKGHLLEVLQFAGIGWDRARTDTPSWVVDWSISREPVTLAHWFVDDHLQYRAAVQRESEISRGSDNTRIRIRGQRIDYVLTMGLIMGGPNLNERNRPLETVDELIAWFNEAEDLVHRNVAAPYHNGQDLSQVIWRTVIGDRAGDARPAPAAYGEKIQKFKQVMLALKELAARCGTDLSGIKELPSAANPLLDHFSDWDSLKDWLASMSDFTWLCGGPSFPLKLAITNEGYIAMVPKGTSSGDSICAIWGAQVPFVIRSTEDGNYKLVGECYVHGMMDGECFSLPVKDEIFEIV